MSSRDPSTGAPGCISRELDRMPKSRVLNQALPSGMWVSPVVRPGENVLKLIVKIVAHLSLNG